MNQKILTKQAYFQKIPLLRLQVMHDYVHWQCSIDYCVKLSLIAKTLQKIALIL